MSDTTEAPAETGNLEADAKNDLNQAIAQAKSLAKVELESAASAADKLLLIAAGDEQALLTEAEAGALPYLVHLVPAPLQGLISSFASLAVSKAEGSLNTTVSDDTKKAIVVAQAFIATTLAAAEKVLN